MLKGRLWGLEIKGYLYAPTKIFHPPGHETPRHQKDGRRRSVGTVAKREPFIW